MQSGCLKRQTGPKLEAERRRSEQSVLDRLLNDDGIPEMFIISVGHEAVCYDDVGNVHFAKFLCTKGKVLCKLKLCKYNFPVKSRAKALKDKPAPELQADTRNTVPAIGAVLRRAREHNELSLREVERRTGRSSAYLSQVERGLIRQPDPVVLLELAEMYRLDFLTLARWAGWASDSETSNESVNSATYLVRQILELDDEQRAHVMTYIQDLMRKART
jgi:transcriptional regulator with XRE-family HTH domain